MSELIFSSSFVVATVLLITSVVVVFVWDRKYITRTCDQCNRANFIPKRDPFFNCKYCGYDLDARAKEALLKESIG